MQKLAVVIIACSLAFSHFLAAQIEGGFEPDEAKALIAICNSYTFLESTGSDSAIIPDNFKRVYTSDVIGLDNVFQVYEGDNAGVINFRGSTAATASWIENFYSAMIPAKGTMKIDKLDHPYKFANHEKAAVHSGYALTIVLMSQEILIQLARLNAKGIYQIYITGHSQGGALAHLCCTYLDHLPDDRISPLNTFKTYSFANPMCGNNEFADEYNAKYKQVGLSYSVINPDDLIPRLPLGYEEERNLYGDIFYKSWADLIRHGKKPRFKDRLLQVFQSPLALYVNSSNLLIEQIIATYYISIDLPGYVHDINYYPVGEIRYLELFPRPELMVDTNNMSRKEIRKLKRDKDGKYYGKKESYSAHKPYYYYLAILMNYFPEEYDVLEQQQSPSSSLHSGHDKKMSGKE